MGADTGTAATTGPLESCACPYVAGGPGIKPCKDLESSVYG